MSTAPNVSDRSRTCEPRALGTGKVGIAQYLSEDFYEREKERLWRRCWLLAGRANEIPSAGDFFVYDLEVVNASILVVRGKDGVIRAFHNSCKHRGARVRYQDKGSCKALTCTFHGWVYGLDGRLIGVPFEQEFAAQDWRSMRLEPVSVDVWGGFVFVNLAPRPEWSLAEYLEPLPEALRNYFEREDWTWYTGYKGVFRANWKIMVDVQAEGHHGPFLHRRSVTGGFGPGEVPAVAYPDSIGVPYWLGAYRPPDDGPAAIQQTHVSRLALKHGIASLYTEKGTPSVMQHYPGAVNWPGKERWMFDDYTLFPNTVLLILDRQVLIQRCWPLGLHKTAWEISHYFADPVRNFGDLFSREQGVIGEWNTITEDMVTVEGIDRSFRSGAVDGMYLSDLEVGVRSYQRRILDEVGMDPSHGVLS
jgi:nitrite reductase/ring-hydroxylating ferredoxin subunit